MDRFEEVKLRVKEASDLVALVESYIPLKPRGREFVALCPFHQEKTPSFYVVPDGQFFHCFGCGKNGDVFNFVMEREGWTFREAFEQLASRAGISTEGVFGNRPQDSAPRVDVHGALAAVRDYFQGVLRSSEGEAHRSYLGSRGLLAAIEPFGIGAHPAEPGRLQRFARQKGLPLAPLEQAGLLGHTGREPFAGRVMFPIEDERGRVVGFGGRVLGKSDEQSGPKYLNSPESPHFNKRRVLFGLKHAKKSGVRRIVVMEGYTDVIACHLAGMTGAVATLGTALTHDHAQILQRYATEGVVLLFDGDPAGFRAADKAFRELVRTALKLSIALLEGGVDPADLAAPPPGLPAEEVQQRRARLQAVMDGAEDVLAVWFRLLRKRFDLRETSEVMKAAAECGSVLATLDEPARREIVLGRMAPHLGLSTESLRRQIKEQRRAPASPPPAAAVPDRVAELARTPAGRAELELLSVLLAEPQLVLEPEVVQSDEPLVRELIAELQAAVQLGHVTRDAAISALFTRCTERAELRAVLARAATHAPKIKNPREFLHALQQGRRQHATRAVAQRLRLELQAARAQGDQAQADQLMRRYLETLRGSGAATIPPATTP